MLCYVACNFTYRNVLKDIKYIHLPMTQCNVTDDFSTSLLWKPQTLHGIKQFLWHSVDSFSHVDLNQIKGCTVI